MSHNHGKPGRPSHTYHSYMVGGPRLMLEVEVQPGNQHTPKHSAPDLWALLDRLGSGRLPALSRGDKAWGVANVCAEILTLGQLYRDRAEARTTSMS